MRARGGRREAQGEAGALALNPARCTGAAGGAPCGRDLAAMGVAQPLRRRRSSSSRRRCPPALPLPPPPAMAACHCSRCWEGQGQWCWPGTQAPSLHTPHATAPAPPPPPSADAKKSTSTAHQWSRKSSTATTATATPPPSPPPAQLPTHPTPPTHQWNRKSSTATRPRMSKGSSSWSVRYQSCSGCTSSWAITPTTPSIAHRACTRSDSANHARRSGLAPRPRGSKLQVESSGVASEGRARWRRKGMGVERGGRHARGWLGRGSGGCSASEQQGVAASQPRTGQALPVVGGQVGRLEVSGEVCFKGAGTGRRSAGAVRGGRRAARHGRAPPPIPGRAAHRSQGASWGGRQRAQPRWSEPGCGRPWPAGQSMVGGGWQPGHGARCQPSHPNAGCCGCIGCCCDRDAVEPAPAHRAEAGQAGLGCQGLHFASRVVSGTPTGRRECKRTENPPIAARLCGGARPGSGWAQDIRG